MTWRKISVSGLVSALPFMETYREYDVEKFKADIIAALTVAIVALPQSMAYAMIAGVNPKYGLYAAIIPVIVSSLFGSSRFLIAGPTNAISMVISSTMSSLMIGSVVANALPEEQKMYLLFFLGFMMGAIQLLMGIAKFGGLINFVSHSVIIGFTAGAGVLIAFNQLKNLLGLSVTLSPHFVEAMIGTFEHIGQTNMYALGLGLFTISFILVCKKFFPKVPGPFLSMIFSAVIVAVFGLTSEGVKVIGEIPRSLPPLSALHFDTNTIRLLLMPALALAILGIVEALSISKSIASSTGDKIDGNQEFIAQGLANMVAAFTSAIPGTGSFTRSAVNFKSGAKTRFAGIFSGLLVLITLLLFASYAKFIPSASLAGILMVIAYSMVDKKGLTLAYKATRSDRTVMIITFLATIFFDLEMAIYFGVFLSIALFVRKSANSKITKVIPRESDNKLFPYEAGKPECFQISIYQIDGELFFGSINELENQIAKFRNKKSNCVIFRMKQVHIIDASGAHLIEDILKECQSQNGKLILTGVSEKVMQVMNKVGLVEKIGRENIVEDTTQAVKLAYEKYIDKEACKNCPKHIFNECK